MKTELLNFEDEKCVEIVKDGDVLAFPTETVFGFGVRYDSLEAFNKLCALKQRTPDKPFTIMVSDKKDIGRFVDLNEKMERLIDVFMPGEVTFLFPAKKDLAHHLTLSSKSVGIRIAALKEAAYNGVFTMRYIDKVLYEWNRKGYKTVEEVNNRFKKDDREEKVFEPSILNFDWLNEK